MKHTSIPLLAVACVGSCLVQSAPAQPQKATLFVGNNVSDTVSVYAVNPDGTLVEIEGSPFAAGENVTALALTADGRYLAATNAGQANVEELWLFRVGETGALTPVPDAPFLTGDGPLGLAFTRNDVLLSPAAGDDELYVFNLEDERLVAGPGSPHAVDNFPNEVAATPDGRYAYTSHLFDGVQGYSVSPDGEIGALPGSPYPIPGTRGAFEIIVSPDGRHVYVGMGLDNALAGYEVQPDGSLTDLPGSPFPTSQTSAVNLAMDPSGRFVFVCHVVSDSVMTMKRNPDGTLEAVPGSVQVIGSDVRKAVASDKYLFVTDESSIDPGVGVMVYAIELDGKLTLVDGSPFAAGARPQDMVLFDPAAGIDCDDIRKLKASCKNSKLKAKLKTRLAEGTVLQLSNNGGDVLPVSLNRKGKGKAKWTRQEGSHEVCVIECPEVCAEADCG